MDDVPERFDDERSDTQRTDTMLHRPVLRPVNGAAWERRGSSREVAGEALGSWILRSLGHPGMVPDPGLASPIDAAPGLTEHPRMVVWMPRDSALAIAGLVAIGLFLVAISVPPLFNPIFGEEPTIWAPDGVVYGLLYLAVAGLVRARSRLGVGSAIVLGMLGFTVALGYTLTRFQMVFGSRMMLEVIVVGLLAAAHAVVVACVLGAARRWNLVVELDTRRRAAAALLAGIGFALGLGSMGGDYGIMLDPIDAMPQAYRIVEFWIAIAHFVAFAAIALHGRFATIGSLALTVGGILIAVQVLAALVGSQYGIESVLDSVVLWTSLLIAWVAAGLLLLASAGMGIQQAATKPLASDQA
jgi:hypothetical protein